MSNEVHRRVEEVLGRGGLLGSDLLVALSGGVDSVCLFHVLRDIRERHGGRLVAAHVDHGLRATARDDEWFCRRLCFRTGVAFHKWTLPEGSFEGPGGVQERARRLRREYFLRIMEEQSLHAVALGHHADDQVETVLYRLLRGAGLRGVSGMESVSSPFVRPLLGVRRSALEALAERKGWSFRSDPSNEDLRFARNRLRRVIVPALSAVHPGAEDSLLRFARLAREEDEVLSRLARECLAEHGKPEPEGIRVPVSALRTVEPPIRRRVYLAAWQRIGCDPASLELRHLEMVDALLESGRAHRFAPVPGPGRFAVSYLHLWVFHPPVAVPDDTRLRLRLEESVALPGEDSRVVWGLSRPNGAVGLELAPCARGEMVHVRPRQPGDRVSSASGRRRKVKDLLMEEKVPLWRRQRALMVTRGSDAVGVLGTGFAIGGETGGGTWVWCENGTM